MSSSVGSAEQSATSLRSAEPPATPCHVKILSIRDVQGWLAEERIASCSSADMQRIREAVAVLSSPKPRQVDVQPLQSKWQVAQQKDKKRRPLEEVLSEFQGKVIKAAQKLQQELADSAEKPALDGSTTAADEDPVLLARLKERQRKRATETETQDQRPVAKPKATERQSKRTACTLSGSFETPASKKKYWRLTQGSFAAMKRFFAPAVSGSSGSAARPATTAASNSSGSVNMMPVPGSRPPQTFQSDRHHVRG